MVTSTWCHRDFLGMMGCRAAKVLKWVQLQCCSSSFSDLFCTFILKSFVFQGMQGSPGLPGLIGREGQKVCPFHYVKHHNDLLFLHQNLLRLCWWLSVRFVEYGLFEQRGQIIIVIISFSLMTSHEIVVLSRVLSVKCKG